MTDTIELIYNEAKPYNKKHWRTFEASSDIAFILVCEIIILSINYIKIIHILSMVFNGDA